MHHVISVLFPIFALILAGYLSAKTGKLSVNAAVEINRFVVWLALPAQLFQFTSGQGWHASIHPGFVIAFSAGTFAIYFALLLWRRYQQDSWQQASFYSLTGSYANTGYIGIPLCLLAFGEPGMAPSVIGCLIVVCVLFGVAMIFVEIGRNHQQGFSNIVWVVFKSLVTNPLLVAPVLGVIVSSAELQLYGPFHQFMFYLGAAASPCALVSIGLFLYQKRTQLQGGGGRRQGEAELSSFKNSANKSVNKSANQSVNNFVHSLELKDAWFLSVIKLLVQPFIVWVIAGPIFHLPDFWLSAAVLLSAIPTGTGPFMLAQYYQAEEEGALISRVVLFTTLGSVITLSILLWLLPL